MEMSSSVNLRMAEMVSEGSWTRVTAGRTGSGRDSFTFLGDFLLTILCFLLFGFPSLKQMLPTGDRVFLRRIFP